MNLLQICNIFTKRVAKNIFYEYYIEQINQIQGKNYRDYPYTKGYLMNVYSVGANPISYTGHRRIVNTAVRQVAEPVVNRGIEALTGIAEETITAMGKDDATLNYLYKYLPAGTERKLENFDGRRKISVYRGDGYMNKITQRLEGNNPPLTFIRHMKNEGTNENPKLVTRLVSLRNPNYFERINITILDEPRQLFLRVVRDGFETHRALYDSWRDLRQNDVFFKKLAEKLTGRKF